MSVVGGRIEVLVRVMIALFHANVRVHVDGIFNAEGEISHTLSLEDF